MKRRGEEWRRLRKSHLAVYPECRACDSDQDVIVHHLRYRGTVGHGERPGDLVTLCSDCHADLHRELGSSSKLEAQLAFIDARRQHRDLALLEADS